MQTSNRRRWAARDCRSLWPNLFGCGDVLRCRFQTWSCISFTNSQPFLSFPNSNWRYSTLFLLAFMRLPLPTAFFGLWRCCSSAIPQSYVENLVQESDSLGKSELICGLLNARQTSVFGWLSERRGSLQRERAPDTYSVRGVIR